MVAEVVKIKDEITMLPGEPDPEIIKSLEWLLENARKGLLRGLAYATVCSNGALTNGYDASPGRNQYLMMASVSALHFRIYHDFKVGDR